MLQVRGLVAVTLSLPLGLLPLAAATAGACGVERWSVKTGADMDAGRIDLARVVPTTVEDLTKLQAPASLPADARVAPTETTVYSVTALITVYKREDDGDIHAVISSGASTMIVEFADPACVASTTRSSSSSAVNAPPPRFSVR